MNFANFPLTSIHVSGGSYGKTPQNVPTNVHPEMVDFGSGQGRSVFATAGVVGLRRGFQKGENAALV